MADWPLHGWLGGLVLLIVIFVPAFLVLIGTLPFWQRVDGACPYGVVERGQQDGKSCLPDPAQNQEGATSCTWVCWASGACG